MNISVIITTYNQPRWLNLVLLGYVCQEDRDFEIVVADDGSDERTAAVIAKMRNIYGLKIEHIWHEDRGYRRSVILNKATLAARSDYLIYTDGDCIPRSDFVCWHKKLAQKGHFLSAGHIPLPLEMSYRLTEEDIIKKRINSISWLLNNGLPFNRRVLRLIQNPGIVQLMNRLTISKATWNLGNVSTFREYVLRVNGFDETLRYGGADREFGERLKNSGIFGIQIRYAAITFHLHHNRPYKTQEGIQRIKERRKEVIRRKITTTSTGINRHL
jgi:glycosyltransferase involved in cell wall biosynthesis